MELWILFGSFVTLLLIGTPVAFCLGVASFLTVLYMGTSKNCRDLAAAV